MSNFDKLFLICQTLADYSILVILKGIIDYVMR